MFYICGIFVMFYVGDYFVVAEFGFVFDIVFYFWLVGYVLELVRYLLGNILVYELIWMMLENGFIIYEFGLDDVVYKLVFLNKILLIFSGVV